MLFRLTFLVLLVLFGPVPLFALNKEDQAEAKRLYLGAMAALEHHDYATMTDNYLKLHRLAQEKGGVADAELRQEAVKQVLLCCMKGLERCRKTDKGIPEVWAERCRAMPTPRGFPNDYMPFFSYHYVQYHLADYYMFRKDYEKAQWHFAAGETFFQQAVEAAGSDRVILADMNDFRNKNRERLVELIFSRGLRTGAYVENKGALQKWIGKVTKLEGDRVEVRITYSSSAAPAGFTKGRTVVVHRRDVDDVVNLSLNAILEGYR